MSTRPRVLITRTRQQASELAAALESLGAETILIPTIEVAPPVSYQALDAAIEKLSKPDNPIDWLIFTSGNAVHRLMERAHEQARLLYPKRIAVIGPATAKAVEDLGLTPQITPLHVAHEYVAEALAEDLLAHAAGYRQHFLLVCAELTREVIPRILEAAGHTVRVAAAYRNIVPASSIAALRALFSSPESVPEVITFTSSSTAQNLITLVKAAGCNIPSSVATASIGPVTSGTLRSLGYEPTVEASQATIESLADAIAKHLRLS